MAKVARLARSSMVETLEEPFIEAARARGFSGRRVVYAHVVRSSLTPVVTLTGIQAGALLSGAVTVEYVFAWPGLGSLAVQAVGFRDFPLVQALGVFGAFSFVVINLLVDLINGAIDPRLRETV
jgi:peptide/nickel transport system permease protein